MAKTLLSVLIAATQLLSWNASPLYLCLADDGSVCIDFGPDTCGCCHEAEGVCCGGHSECPADHSHDEPAADHDADRALSDPCGCDHVQISEPQMAVRHQAVDADAHSVLSWAIPALDAWACHATGCDAHLSGSTADTEILRPALAELSSVVLRC